MGYSIFWRSKPVKLLSPIDHLLNLSRTDLRTSVSLSRIHATKSISYLRQVVVLGDSGQIRVQLLNLLLMRLFQLF